MPWSSENRHNISVLTALTDRCVNSVSHAWIRFKCFILPSEGLCLDIWCRHFLEVNWGWQQTPRVCSRGELKCCIHSLYAQWNLTKARALKRWPLTHGSQRWQKKRRVKFHFTLVLVTSTFAGSSLVSFPYCQPTPDQLRSPVKHQLFRRFYANVGLIVLRRLLDSLFIN